MKITFKAIMGMSIILFFVYQNSYSASTSSTTANALAAVIASLQITKVSDLDFGKAAAGDAAKVVLPGTSDSIENASFDVQGEINKAYTVVLPADGTVTMTTGLGGVNESIAVSSFASNTSSGSFVLSATGSQSLFVGAGRAALGAAQAAGNYSAAFTVTVSYE